MTDAQWEVLSYQGVIAAAVYGGILWGVLPTNRGVSWQGHLFGAIGGVLAARLVHVRPRSAALSAGR